MTKPHSLTLGITIPAKLPKNMEEARKVTGSFVIAQKAVLGEKGKACGFCGFTSNGNETYPTDGNFREVSVDRLKPVCPHCNAYLHVGEKPVQDLMPFVQGHHGPTTRLIRVPDDAPSPEVFNCLFRAIGIALADKKTEDEARKVYTALANQALVDETMDAFGTNRPSDLKVALEKISRHEGEYENRTEALSPLRLLFHPSTLKIWGTKLRNEFPTVSDASKWPVILKRQVSVIQEAIFGPPEIADQNEDDQSIPLPVHMNDYHDLEEEPQ